MLLTQRRWMDLDPANPVGATRLFEYCVATIPLDTPSVTPAGMSIASLNELGVSGWELVGILPTGNACEPMGFFRRDLIDDIPPDEHFELIGLDPSAAVLGAPSFTLRVLGAGFTPACVVVWNGADASTTFVSSTELSIGVNMDTAEFAMSLSVLVRNGELASNPLVFTFMDA